MSDLVPEGLQPTYPEPVTGDGIRPKLLELLGIEALPDSVDFELGEPTVDEGLQFRSVSYLSSLGETVPGILCIPTGDGPLPGIVCMPGTGGSAEQLTEAEFRPEGGGSYRLMGWARELSRQGFVTLSISLKGCAGRGATTDEWNYQTKLLAPYGVHKMGILVEEALKASRVLQSLPGVDTNRIGMTGMSLGGNATWYSMSCAPWLTAAVPVCGGVGSIERETHEGNHERHGSHWYIPNILRHFDHPDVVAACIAPRPLMIIGPTEDEDMPKSGVDDLIPIVEAAYESAGKPQNFKVHQPPGRHVFEPQYFEWMAGWFKHHLMGDNS